MFDDFNYYRVAILAISTLIIVVFCYKRLATLMQRTFMLAGILGLYIYSGFGAAHSIVPVQYVIYYLLFAFFMAIAFLLTIKMTGRLFKENFDRATTNIEYILSKPLLISFIIMSYLFCVAFPLIYPEVRLSLLWNPPMTDLNTMWNEGLMVRVGSLEKYIRYMSGFLYPLYMVIIFRFLPKYLLALFLFTLPIYIGYCSYAYTSRSAMGMAFVLIVVTLIFTYPHRIRRILMLTFLVIPILLVFFAAYAYLREGRYDYMYISATDLVIGIIYDETRFPIYAQQVMQYASSVDMLQYARYILLYPFPGEKLNIGYDIAVVLGNILVGKTGFSVTLSGAVSESVYIYGQTFFWVQALFIGTVFGLLCRFSESISRYPIIGSFFVVLFGYKFARAGISSIWPIISFQMVPFYIIACSNIFYRRIKPFQPSKQYRW